VRVSKAHSVESKLVSLEGQLQAASRAHRPPDGDLKGIKLAQPLA